MVSLVIAMAAAAGAVGASPTALAQSEGDDPEPVEIETVDDEAPDSEPDSDPDIEPVPSEPLAADPASESPTAERDGGSDDPAAPSGPRPATISGPATISAVDPTPDGLVQASRVAVEGAPDFDQLAPTSTQLAVITEVMYNPSAVYDSRGEWFEVFNPSSAPLDLTGWTLGDEIYDLHTITSLTIPPGEHAVLTRFGETARNGGVVGDYSYGDSVLLFNVGDRIVLRDADGLVVDVVDYSQPGFPDAVGRSISLVDGSWCLATTPMPQGDLGSPGRPNQCEEPTARLVITEILQNPARTSDFIGEWFEVTNVGSASVDMQEFGVQDDDGESFVIDRSIVVDIGESVVIGISDDRTVNGDVEVAFAYGDRMRLHNSFDELVLTDERGILVDAVRWDDGRSFPDPNGASMTLLDPELDNSLGAHWCTSARRWAAGDFASPQAPGDCTPPSYPDVVITEVMFDPERASSERQGEWFEIANVGTETADLAGFTMRTYSTQHTVGELSILAGERAVVAVESDPARNGGVDVDYVYGESLPLYNTISTLEIVAPDGTLIDRVKWSAPLGFPNEKGSSIELRATTADNSLGANWCVSTQRYGDGDFGTPGTAGTCSDPLPPLPLVISEVMRNPAVVVDSRGEWFEVFNPTPDAVDLRNWSVSDDGSEHHVIAGSVVVEPGGYAVVARSGDTSANGGVVADYVIGNGMVLINTVDELVLSDPYGREVDRLEWNTTNLMPRPNGATIARMESAMRSFAPNSDVSNWCVPTGQFGSGDRGTPGALNDCTDSRARAIVINEIHRDPDAVPDAQGEWLELHNASDLDVDISGWTLRDDDVDSFVFDPTQPVVIEAGGYLVAGRNTEALNGGVDIDVQYGVEFIHFNTADEVVLLDRDLAVVDRVAWTANNGFPKVPGATMSLRSPELDNSIGANWCAAVTDQGNGDLGTPGGANVCVVPEPAPANELTHSLFAIADASCSGEIRMSGSELVIHGDVRSNDDIRLSGAVIGLSGSISYGGEFRANGSSVTTDQSPVRDPLAQPSPFDWQLADFAPGGVHALAASAYTYHPDGWTVTGSGSAITPGLHYVNGDVRMNPEFAHLNGVTVVATGAIRIQSGAISLSPSAPGLPALMAGENACSKAGVELNSSNISIRGAVYAPGSQIKVAGSMLRGTDAAIVGTSIKMSGASTIINAEASGPTP